MTAAARLLEPLCRQGDVSNSALRSSVARIYLQGGDVQAAMKHFALVETDPEADASMKKMNAALLASADGEWVKADTLLREILEKDSENYVVCRIFEYSQVCLRSATSLGCQQPGCCATQPREVERGTSLQT